MKYIDIHTGREVKVVKTKCRMLDSIHGWVDCVILKPIYESEAPYIIIGDHDLNYEFTKVD